MPLAPLSSDLLWLAKIIASQESAQELQRAQEAANRAGVIAAAMRHGLAPLLLHRAKQDGVDTSDTRWQPVINSARHTAMQYALFDLARSQISAHLAAQGIGALWIKGIALARSLYPHPTLRPMTDLDVLVRYADREAARSALEALGYALLPPTAALDALHHDALHGGPAGAIKLELHFRLLSDAAALLPLDALDWFWAHTTYLGDLHTLATEAHFLYLCAHAEMQHGQERLYLLRYVDLHLMITQTSLDWALIVDQAVTLRWTLAVERALRLCAAYFATPIPVDLLETLGSRRLSDEDITWATRQRGSGVWERARGSLRVMTPRERVQAVFRLIFPPADYMRHKYARSLAAAYVLRWAGWVIKTTFRRRR